MEPHEYRTPGDPAFVEALGHVIWNVLFLEEKIVRWLSLLVPEQPIGRWRTNKTAQQKGKALRRAVRRIEDPGLRDDLLAWCDRFDDMVKDERNPVAHAHAFTVDMDGRLGLAYTDRHGNERAVAHSPEELQKIAVRIDGLMGELADQEPRLRRP
jgi:hypothetical protein